MSHYRLTSLPTNLSVHERADASREWHTGEVLQCDICDNHWPTSLVETKDGVEWKCPDCFGPGWRVD